MRINFNAVFNQNLDGSLEPKQRIRVGGVEFGPGVKFTRGVAFSGVDFGQFIGHDLEVETEGDILIIKEIY
jgi:hypothetical protein